MNRLLVVCVGNICRSPLGERLLRDLLPPNYTVDSAGIGALVGEPADDVMSDVAAENGVSLDGHVAQQFTPKLAEAYDLILPMEPGHRREITRMVPHVSGRVMLFDRWVGGTGIADPYQKPKPFHENTFKEVYAAAAAWAQKLK